MNSSKTSEDRIKIYLSKLKKHKNKILSKKSIKNIIEVSDISDNDIENMGLHFRRSYARAKRFVDIGKIDIAFRELESIYFYSLHDKSMFSLFFFLFKEVADKVNTKESKKKMIHVTLQAKEFGIRDDLDLIDYYEFKKSKNRMLILTISSILIFCISLITYRSFQGFMSMNGNGAMALKEKFAPSFTSQGLPPITMATDLVVEAVNLISSPKDFYYIEIEDAKVLVFEDAHLYQLKAGVISTMHPVKKISYRVTVYDDLGKSVFNQIFSKESDFSAKWGKDVYIPIDVISSIPRAIDVNPKRIVLDIIDIDFFENVDDKIGVNLDSDSFILKFKYIGNYFQKSFGICKANTVIEVFNSSKDVVKNLEIEIGYIDKEGRIIRSLRRKLISSANSFLKSKSKQSFTISTIFPNEIYPTIEKDFSSIKIYNVMIK
ncbi:hypothetical protein [Borreliella burgdorferi]|uniref:Uncharacterized protein n=6 Tax=Borreliella burgdorferi TaxID=139 RepID=O51109_BORBU|nr:hypothetical protein [Borreliella burgdorferi]AGS66105.1 hypothetical protein L144_00410 [Borreliella burgdorferi CA382]AAC66477.1 conserved hypothetical protein [Borreliella burgdorferi B31]ARS29870.1 hypothetical protein B1U23_00400 [Borreliella burgdorferi]ARS31101.1 hypothetical protein B1U22_00400 [Borreliella burgdorferi]ARS32845.1 hypothetical protein B1U21_03155 [Borreliella burgdorferi]